MDAITWKCVRKCDCPLKFKEAGCWPLRTVTDSWVYPLPEGINVADDSDVLGTMTFEKYAALTGAQTREGR